MVKSANRPSFELIFNHLARIDISNAFPMSFVIQLIENKRSLAFWSDCLNQHKALTSRSPIWTSKFKAQIVHQVTK